MVHAFVMLKSGAGQSRSLVEPIRAIDGVEEAHIVAGTWDIIAEVSAEAVYDVLHSVTADIRGFEGVTDTKTYVSLEE